jgi:gamma-glutamylaminecyclotransferase
VGRGSTILFVYGSLKRGHRNHRLIADQEFLGDAVTEARYRLVDLGAYPGMIEDAAGVRVVGELWAVGDCALGELDEFECADAPYSRAAVAIEGRAGAIEAYFYRGAVPPNALTGGEWPFA